MPDHRFLSIVVPCFNEEEGLREFHRRTSAAATTSFGERYELIFVDDGSRDRTWDVVSQLVDADPRVAGLRLSRNFGHQLALSAGLSVVRGDLVFVLDADLQDPPELLAEMLEVMAERDADVVYGRRRKRAGETAFKRGTAHLFYRTISRIAEVDIPEDAGDFRLMTRRVCDALMRMPERDRFIRGMVAWIGFRQAAVLYDRDARFAGVTKYPLRKMIRFAIDALVGFSMAPLRISAYAAMALSACLAVLVLHAAYSWLFLDTVPGWTSIVMLVLIVSIIQLVTLSIVGEYVGRGYLQSKERPLFLIDELRRHEVRDEQ